MNFRMLTVEINFLSFSNSIRIYEKSKFKQKYGWESV